MLQPQYQVFANFCDRKSTHKQWNHNRQRSHFTHRTCLPVSKSCSYWQKRPAAQTPSKDFEKVLNSRKYNRNKIQQPELVKTTFFHRGLDIYIFISIYHIYWYICHIYYVTYIILYYIDIYVILIYILIYMSSNHIYIYIYRVYQKKGDP